MTAPLPRGRGRDRRIPPTRQEGPPPVRFRYDAEEGLTVVRRFRYDHRDRTPLPQRFRYDGEHRKGIL